MDPDISTQDIKTAFAKAEETLMQGNKIVIISHRSPDGDAVGSNLALRLGLEALGKKVVSACVDKVPDNSEWLPKGDTFVQDFDYYDFDVIVSVDCAAQKLMAFHEKKPEILQHIKPFVNFDHHITNDGFGSVNVVQPQACSAAIILYDFFRYCGWRITRDVATCLLHGIYFDTGGMMHSNTTQEVFKVAGELMSMGADLKRISRELFHTTPVNQLRLWGRIMERAYVNEDGVTVSAVNEEDYRVCGASSHDTGGVIDYLNAVPGTQYSILLSEDPEKGIVKGSLRTQREDVNLSDVAGQWGGGGHPKASGFGVPGKLRPVTSWQIESMDGNEGSVRF